MKSLTAERGSEILPEPTPTSRSKRRRNTEAQPFRPSPTPLDEEAGQHEERKEVFLTIARSVDSVVASFDGSKQQFAKEATAYITQALRKLMKADTGPAAARTWATVAAPAAADAPTSRQTLARLQAPLPVTTPKPTIDPAAGGSPHSRPHPRRGSLPARKVAPFALRQTICQTFDLDLADLPHVYHVGTGYSLKPLNKQIQQKLLEGKEELARCLGAHKVEMPTKWYTYVVPRCPTE
ncbi:uncharacterized protein CLUP02_00338 [Colletotrichum lupini]|uniref:Uncharacterized protein n=1 Tax=Colletotrichum lupini TaxID=145971 RepID=A0A9Q8SA49_9PEZI|nr:uncharacterized protein CLUP02_00338 [Colletotrichum lupini]UQC73692.1 hypothetical protein CLUP02_00338 [Colletotrichum lupini]